MWKEFCTLVKNNYFKNAIHGVLSNLKYFEKSRVLTDIKNLVWRQFTFLGPCTVGCMQKQQMGVFPKRFDYRSTDDSSFLHKKCLYKSVWKKPQYFMFQLLPLSCTDACSRKWMPVAMTGSLAEWQVPGMPGECSHNSKEFRSYTFTMVDWWNRQ